MKRLHDKVNVIPLIAKADTLTPEECQLFKKQVFVCACVASVGQAVLLSERKKCEEAISLAQHKDWEQ